jgi:putative hydrolase of the HAD superfamily
MQRLALFDLDNTLVDRQLGFSAWAAEFADERQLGGEAARWLIAADRRGAGPRDHFFREVREHFGLAEPVEELWAAYRARMPGLVRCDPKVLDGLSQLRASGWRVGIVSNGTADNQLAKIERSGGWMIGDSPEHDIVGGRAAGLRTMWVGGQGPWTGGVMRADRTVADASAAISLLRGHPVACRPGRGDVSS